MYGFEIGQMKNHESALKMIRSTLLIAAYLGTVLHVPHLRRRSSWSAELIDNMFRASTTGFLEEWPLSRFQEQRLPKPPSD
jgi:hypothetical protein